MSKMGEIAIEIQNLEKDKQCLVDSLKWLLNEVQHVDHDCKTSPDSGCSWCHKIKEIKDGLSNC